MRRPKTWNPRRKSVVIANNILPINVAYFLFAFRGQITGGGGKKDIRLSFITHFRQSAEDRRKTILFLLHSQTCIYCATYMNYCDLNIFYFQRIDLMRNSKLFENYC